MITSKALLDTAVEMAPEESTALLQKWLNHGKNQLNSAFNRYWNRLEKTTAVIANQRYYQFPEDAIKIIAIKIVMTNGTIYTLSPVDNEDEWNTMISGNQNNRPYPTKFFVRGSDEIGIFPMPNLNIPTNQLADGSFSGLSIAYMPRDVDWRFLEYNTGTVAVTAGQPTVTLSGATFLQNQVGMSFKVDDGTHDLWYKINQYTDTTHLSLENNFAGYSGAAKPFIIGEIPIYPDEFQESPLDYMMYRHSQKMGNGNDAKDFMSLFNDAKQRMRSEYATATTQQVIHTDQNRRASSYDLFTGEPNKAHY